MILRDFIHPILVVALLLTASHAQALDDIVSEIEIQEDVQRLASSSTDLLTQAVQEVNLQTRGQETLRLRRLIVIYSSSLLEIATGPAPVENLLDLVTFMRLSRRSVDIYWTPKVFGTSGKKISHAFWESEREAWKILAKISNSEQRQRLRHLIDDWLKRHPRQVRVESVRFKEFSRFAAAQKSNDDGKGLFASIRQATKTADQALLLAERSLYLAQRMPFLLRQQVILGSREVTAEIESAVSDEFVGDLSELTMQSQPLVRDVTKLVEVFDQRKHRGPPGELRRILNAAEGLAGKATETLREAREGDLINVVIAGIEKADRMMSRWTLYLLLIGLGWSIFWWTGYYIVKRKSASKP